MTRATRRTATVCAWRLRKLPGPGNGGSARDRHMAGCRVRARALGWVCVRRRDGWSVGEGRECGGQFGEPGEVARVSSYAVVSVDEGEAISPPSGQLLPAA